MEHEQQDKHPTVTVEKCQVMRLTFDVHHIAIGDNDCTVTVEVDPETARGLFNEIGLALKDPE